MTRAFVIGHPIAHSRSPLIHGYWLRQHGLSGSYERIDVAPEALPAFLQSLRERGYAGGNVTLPHKEEVCRLLEEVTLRAERLGAVNTLVGVADGRIRGDNTDGEGFLDSVDAAVGPDWRGEVGEALVIGAGGAARAVAAALLEAGIERVRVANRTAARVEPIVRFDPRRVGYVSAEELGSALAGTDLLVNATSLGMAGQPLLLLDLGAMKPSAIVADIVYVPAVTRLLADARACGLRTVGGLGMLLYQAVPGFEAWFGVRPSVTPELRALVEADIEGRA